MKREEIYEIYFFSEPYFMVLENSSIIDINIKKEEALPYKKTVRRFGPIKQKQIIEISYNDDYFDANLKESSRDTFTLIVLSHKPDGTFIQQLDIHGENLVVSKILKSKVLRFTFEQITTNSGWMSIHPKFIEAQGNYISEKKKWDRDKKINQLLS
jgi:hypothetical protein